MPGFSVTYRVFWCYKNDSGALGTSRYVQIFGLFCYQNHSKQPRTTAPCYTPTTMTQKILTSIPQDLLERYNEYQMSSKELGAITGFHPAAIRRAIKRPPRPQQPKNKTALIAARKAFRTTLAHLPPREIKKLANVSLSTANRIRKLRHEI